MRAPFNWLKEFVEFDATPRELAERLTFSGLEVETIETAGAACPGVVAAEVMTVEPHPGASGLLLCEVDAGSGPKRVVCGARNFKKGDKAAYAGPGTVLPNGRRIEETLVRGERSQGMLCAEDELGVSDDHSGLMLLPADCAPGTALDRILGPPEAVLVIEVTPNRPDCLSIIGIAREIAALYRSKLAVPPVRYEESDVPVETMAKVRVRDRTACPRYTARVVSGLRVAPSPLPMRLRLIRGGVRPINNIVDITNYVLLEYGQPLHAFDRSLLNGGRIVVRRAAPGEKMATLDGVERAITPEMLVIADAKRPVALAGVMGGAGSEIHDDTTEVLLESACFDPGIIRRTAKTLGVSTESSYRFERGVDPLLAEVASARATELLVRAGGVAARGVIDVFPRKPVRRRVRCRFDRVRGLTGTKASNDVIVAAFESLQLQTLVQSGKACFVRIPSFRTDLVLEADLIEEFARVYGLDKIPVGAPRCRIVHGADNRPIRAVTACRNAAVGLGLTEIVNYSFVSPRLLDMFDAGGAPTRVALPNPVSADQSVLRPSLIPQMVQSLGGNLARQTEEAALFEMGRVYFKDGSGGLREEERIAIGMMGPVGRAWDMKRKPVDADEVFLWCKGAFESLCAALGAGAPALDPARPAWAEEDAAASLTLARGDGRVELGVLGVVKAAIRSEWRMSRPIAVLEAALKPLISGVFDLPAIKPVAAYPSVTRDVAVVVSTSVRNEEVLEIIRQNAPSELTKVVLFDMYTGESIGVGRKSLAYSLTYRSLERTLTDEEANALHETLKSGMVKELNAEVRES